MSFRQIFSRITNIARANTSGWRGRDSFRDPFRDSFDEELRRAQELIREAREREERANAPAEEPASSDGVEVVAVAYRALGVAPSDPFEVITRAYRALIVRHHPDRHARLAPEEQEVARRKAQEINDAYRVIKEHRGRK